MIRFALLLLPLASVSALLGACAPLFGIGEAAVTYLDASDDAHAYPGPRPDGSSEADGGGVEDAVSSSEGGEGGEADAIECRGCRGVECPAGRDCEVRCAPSPDGGPGCTGAISCPEGFRCRVTCDGPGACRDVVLEMRPSSPACLRCVGGSPGTPACDALYCPRVEAESCTRECGVDGCGLGMPQCAAPVCRQQEC